MIHLKEYIRMCVAQENVTLDHSQFIRAVVSTSGFLCTAEDTGTAVVVEITDE
jgi:hypothetical protein